MKKIALGLAFLALSASSFAGQAEYDQPRSVKCVDLRGGIISYDEHEVRRAKIDSDGTTVILKDGKFIQFSPAVQCVTVLQE